MMINIYEINKIDKYWDNLGGCFICHRITNLEFVRKQWLDEVGVWHGNEFLYHPECISGVLENPTYYDNKTLKRTMECYDWIKQTAKNSVENRSHLIKDIIFSQKPSL